MSILQSGRDEFSYILVQVKNRQNYVLGDALKKKPCRACEDAAGLFGSEVPHLGILMSLRSKTGREKVEVIYPFV